MRLKHTYSVIILFFLLYAMFDVQKNLPLLFWIVFTPLASGIGLVVTTCSESEALSAVFLLSMSSRSVTALLSLLSPAVSCPAVPLLFPPLPPGMVWIKQSMNFISSTTSKSGSKWSWKVEFSSCRIYLSTSLRKVPIENTFFDSSTARTLS